jgi:probable HAF family extracellular repeat protein
MPIPRPLLPPSFWVLCLSILCSAALHAAEYSLIQMPPPLIHAAGLNNHGDVVGDAGSGTSTYLHGALVYHHRNGELTELPCQGAQCSASANDIDDQGNVIGSNYTPLGLSPLTAMIWLSNGGITWFQNSFFSTGAGLNNHSQAVWNTLSIHGIEWGNVTDLLGQYQFTLVSMLQCGFGFCDAQSGGAAINDLGHAVGWSDWGAEPPSEPGFEQERTGIHAVMWVNGTPKDLGALGDNTYASATSVNNFDEVVGNSMVGGASHAFLYRKGKMRDLGNLPHEPLLNSDANDINDRGEIVGWSDVRLDADHSVTQRAFVMNNGKMQNLTFLLDPHVWAKLRLTQATAVNCHGWIAADGYEAATGAKHAYLLIPSGPHRKECPRPR